MGKTALSHASRGDEKKLGNAREAGKEAHVPRPLRAQAGEGPVSKTQKHPRRWVQGRRTFWTFGGMSGGGGDFMERICPFERIFCEPIWGSPFFLGVPPLFSPKRSSGLVMAGGGKKTETQEPGAPFGVGGALGRKYVAWRRLPQDVQGSAVRRYCSR